MALRFTTCDQVYEVVCLSDPSVKPAGEVAEGESWILKSEAACEPDATVVTYRLLSHTEVVPLTGRSGLIHATTLAVSKVSGFSDAAEALDAMANAGDRASLGGRILRESMSRPDPTAPAGSR